MAVGIPLPFHLRFDIWHLVPRAFRKATCATVDVLCVFLVDIGLLSTLFYCCVISMLVCGYFPERSRSFPFFGSGMYTDRFHRSRSPYMVVYSSSRKYVPVLFFRISFF